MPDISPIASAATAEERVDCVASLKRLYLRYPLADVVSTDLENLLRYGALGARFGTSASTYMLIGDSGSGKTALLKRFCAKHPMQVHADGNVHPVLFVEVPPKTTRKALAERILTSLGVAVPTNATEIRLTTRALHHLREQKVGVLVLDEAQHLTIPEKRQLNYEAADWVKGLANAGVCAIVLAGVPDAWEAYLYNGQLRRRSCGNRRLSPFHVSDELGWRTFTGLLRAFRGLLPFEDASSLGSRLTALQFHNQCGGYLGRLADFLCIVAINGLEAEVSCLTNELLAVSAEQVADLGNANWQNPFDMTEAALLDAAARTEEMQNVGAGLVQFTGLRRGRRGLRQADVLG